MWFRWHLNILSKYILNAFKFCKGCVSTRDVAKLPVSSKVSAAHITKLIQQIQAWRRKLLRLTSGYLMFVWTKLNHVDTNPSFDNPLVFPWQFLSLAQYEQQDVISCIIALWFWFSSVENTWQHERNSFSFTSNLSKSTCSNKFYLTNFICTTNLEFTSITDSLQMVVLQRYQNYGWTYLRYAEIDIKRVFFPDFHRFYRNTECVIKLSHWRACLKQLSTICLCIRLANYVILKW